MACRTAPCPAPRRIGRRWPSARSPTVHAHGQTADPGRRHRPLPAHADRRDRAGPADRPRDRERIRARGVEANRAELAAARSCGGGAAGASRQRAHRSGARSNACRPESRSANGSRIARAALADRSRFARSSCCRRATGSTRAATSGSRGCSTEARSTRSKQLLERKLDPNLPVMRAIGVREIAQYLSGELTREEAIAAGQQATRRYAKRQYTWFAHQPPADWPRFNDPLDGDCRRQALELLGRSGLVDRRWTCSRRRHRSRAARRQAGGRPRLRQSGASAGAQPQGQRDRRRRRPAPGLAAARRWPRRSAWQPRRSRRQSPAPMWS